MSLNKLQLRLNLPFHVFILSLRFSKAYKTRLIDVK